jgi:hypothetical protein
MTDGATEQSNRNKGMRESRRKKRGDSRERKEEAELREIHGSR